MVREEHSDEGTTQMSQSKAGSHEQKGDFATNIHFRLLVFLKQAIDSCTANWNMCTVCISCNQHITQNFQKLSFEHRAIRWFRHFEYSTSINKEFRWYPFCLRGEMHISLQALFAAAGGKAICQGTTSVMCRYVCEQESLPNAKY